MSQFGHNTASRFQRSVVTCNSTSWTKLEGSSPLSNRVFTELYNKSQAATLKLYLTMTYDGATPSGDGAQVKYAKAVETGAYHMEPVGPGITLWGRSHAATSRVIVTEYAAG